MRIDHAPLMVKDADQDYHPGYSFLGRMKAFCEMSGMMTAVSYSDRAS
jgi:mannonate dehydratase